MTFDARRTLRTRSCAQGSRNHGCALAVPTSDHHPLTPLAMIAPERQRECALVPRCDTRPGWSRSGTRDARVCGRRHRCPLIRPERRCALSLPSTARIDFHLHGCILLGRVLGGDPALITISPSLDEQWGKADAGSQSHTSGVDRPARGGNPNTLPRPPRPESEKAALTSWCSANAPESPICDLVEDLIRWRFNWGMGTGAF